MITSIINASIDESHVPFFQAHIKPLLKKQSLDQEIMKKIQASFELLCQQFWKKVIFEQLEKHCTAVCLSCEIETALWKVQNYELSSLDVEDYVVALIMLDLSAAFDTINHALLLSCLRDMYGIHDQALVWIRSYLSDKLQRVNIKETLSDKQELSFGVHRGPFSGRSCTASILNLCPISFNVLVFYIIHMLTTEIRLL